MKNLILSILLLCGFSLSAQNIYLNNQVKNNTPSSSRTGAALEVMEPYTVSGTDTYTVSISVTGLYSGAETYTAGDQFTLQFPNANTGAATININSEGAIAIEKEGGALSAGDLIAGGIYRVAYDGTAFQIISGAGSGGGSGTLTSVGLTLGTSGTDAGVSGSPLTSDGNITLNLPSASVTNRGLLTSADWTTFNATSDALALKANIGWTFRRLTSSHTLDATDLSNYSAGQRMMVEMNSGSANNLTIPANSTVAFPIGTSLEVKQYGGGQTTFVAAGGVTIRATAGILTIGNQYSGGRLIKVDTDEWYLDNGSPTVLSSTYTPTLTNTTNVNASTAYVTGYHRVGNSVTVYGKIDIDATAAASTATVLGFSLPVASALTAEEELGGSATSNSASATSSIRIMADATNDRASFVFLALTTNNDSYNFNFSYQVK